MTNLLIKAKKAYWLSSRSLTPAYLSSLEGLLLENLAKLGEITEDDRAWASQAVADTFPDAF